MDSLKPNIRMLYPFINLFLSFFFFFHLAIHRPDQRGRLVILLPLIFFGILSFKQSLLLPFASKLAIIWAQSILLNLLHVSSLLLIEKQPSPLRRSLRSSYSLWSNPRLISISGNPSTEEESAALKYRFIISRLAKLALFYTLHQSIQPRLYAAIIGTLKAEDVADTAPWRRFPAALTMHSALVRSYVAVAWICDNYVTMNTLHALLGLITVSTGFHHPHDWSPLFGGLRGMCGLRSFWSRFWHRLARRPYTNVGVVVVESVYVVGFPRALLRAIIVSLVVFLVSGLSHAAVSRQMGWRDWLDVKWFMLNFLGCLVETVVMGSVAWVAARLSLQRELYVFRKSWLGCFIGFAWVFCFFYWSVPSWQYPRLHQELIEKERWEMLRSFIGDLNS
ncbi:hypothetical protein F4802DRAFT_590222 [Xylaria palmicola]|nr:hypothetical protein F4802DRAFT_590222 [Xylaria palmicola]